MFHHRPVSFTGDAIAQNSNMLSGVRHQNENLINRGKQVKHSSTSHERFHSDDSIISGKKSANKLVTASSGKKSSARRRAFGDISNKRANKTFGKESSSLGNRNALKTDALKPHSNHLLPRTMRRGPITNGTRFDILPQQSKPSRIEEVLDHTSKKLDAGGQQSSFSQQHPESMTTIQAKSYPPMTFETVPDIERPAGRTWKEQLEYDLKSEDDLASISSIESILKMDSCFGSNNGSEIDRDTDWKRQKEIDDEEDRQIQQEIQAIMDREQKETEEGLNVFYETISNLEILGDKSYDINCDRLDEDEDELLVTNFSGLDLSLSNDVSLPL